jgi:ribonuclease I
MTTYWPDSQYAETDPNYDTFWEHEWTKHGTCSTLSQYDYFSSAIALIKKLGTPSDFTNAVGSSMSADTLRKDFGGATYASLQCASGSYIDGVFTCWAQENGFPTTQIECPADVQAEDLCSGSTINVASF